jgi:hypothetical protein
MTWRAGGARLLSIACAALGLCVVAAGVAHAQSSGDEWSIGSGWMAAGGATAAWLANYIREIVRDRRRDAEADSREQVAIKKDVDALGGQVQSVAASINTLAGSVTQLTETMGGVKATVSHISVEVDRLRDTAVVAADFARAVGSLERRMSKLEDRT